MLIVTPWYRPQVGGVAEVSERLRSGLARAGVDTHLLVLDERRELLADPVAPNVWRMAVHGGLFGQLTLRRFVAALLYAAPTLRRLRRFVRSRRIGTVLLLFPIEFAWAFLALRRLTGVRLIASLHGAEIRRYRNYSSQFRWLMRRVLRNAAAITVPSQPLAEAVKEILPGAAPRIAMVPNAVDTEWFTPPHSDDGRRGGPPTVLHISNFASLKRTVDIVDAFAAADLPPGARLVFVGDGPTLAPTRARAAEKGIADRTEFTGALEDVRPRLHEADVLVLPSEIETAPLVLLEAMACGVPWIATAYGAAAETPEGECGIVVPAHDAPALAAAMSSLLHDRDRARAMGGRGREIAVRDYSLTQYIDRHLALLAP